MEGEYIEEISTDVAENETSYLEGMENNTDDVLLDSGTNKASNLENGSSDVELGQDENEGFEGLVDEEAENETVFTAEELQEILTSVLDNERKSFMAETFAMQEVPARTLFNTPLDEFSVSEGLLLCIFMLLFAYLLNSIFKGSHWFGKF